MAKQNIYDNETFFEGYKKIRDNEANANNLFEIPALFSMMPDLTGKRVLDLGCGFGEHCMRCIRQGAEKVVGIDISEKMLEVARKEHSDAGITYVNMPMEEISQLNETFDVVVSSLAFHYVEDFSGVVRNIYDLLEPGGNFIFSQENPLCTCHSGENRWTRDENGEKLYLNLANYGVERTDGIVIEGDSQHYAQMPYYLIPTVNSTDAISDFASKGYYVLMPYAQGIKKMDDVRDTVTINSILTTSDQAYSKTNLNSDTLEKEDGDEDGPFDLGVSITETLDGGKETQIVYYSSSSLMDSQINQMVSGGNEKLVMASLSSLVDTEDSTTVSIPSKSLEVSYLTLTAYDASFWKICTIGLIPGAFLLIGFMIWLKRRKA